MCEFESYFSVFAAEQAVVDDVDSLADEFTARFEAQLSLFTRAEEHSASQVRQTETYDSSSLPFTTPQPQGKHFASSRAKRPQLNE